MNGTLWIILKENFLRQRTASFAEEAAMAGIVLAAFLLLFLAGELLRRKQTAAPETTRKLIHFGGCLIAMSFPFLLTSSWSVFALAAGFSVWIGLGKRFGFLHSIHDVERESSGGVYHPAAIFVCFLISSVMNNMLFYEIAMLVLAISDSMAALTGKVYGRSKYNVDNGERKSVEGSTVFFLSAFLAVHLSLLLFSPLGRLECVLVALLIGILLTLFEAISLNGSDNLFIPLGTIFILAKNTNPDLAELLFQFEVLALSFALLHGIMRPYRRIGLSGFIALALFVYTAWGLVDFAWSLPVFLAVFLLCRTDWFLSDPEDRAHKPRILETFYRIAVPELWLLAANLVWKYADPRAAALLYAPFITALLAQLMLLRADRVNRPVGTFSLRLLAETFLFAIPFLLNAALIPHVSSHADATLKWTFVSAAIVFSAPGICVSAWLSAETFRRILRRAPGLPKTASLRLRLALDILFSLLALAFSIPAVYGAARFF